VGIVRGIRQQRLTQQPDRIGGAQLAVALALLDLRAIKVGPTVEDARRQITMVEESAIPHLGGIARSLVDAARATDVRGLWHRVARLIHPTTEPVS